MKTASSYRTRLTLIIILFAVLPLFLLGLTLSIKVYSSYQDQFIIVENKIMNRAANEIQMTVHEITTSVDTAMSITEIMDQDSRRQANILSQLLYQHLDTLHNDIIVEISLFDHSGKELHRVSRTKIFRPADLSNESHLETFGFSARKEKPSFDFIAPKEEGDLAHLIISRPIIDVQSGLTEGVLVVNVALHRLWENTVNTPIGESGQMFITDLQGHVVAHPNPSVIFRRSVHINQGKGGLVMTGLNGEKVICSSIPFQLGEIPFYIVAQVPFSEAMAYSYHFLLITGTFMLFFFLLSIMASVIVVRKIMKPLKSLADTARRISGGDLGILAEESGSSEIKDLSQAFNHMTTQLTGKIRSLQEAEKEIDQSYSSMSIVNKLLNLSLNSTSLVETLEIFLDQVLSLPYLDLAPTGAIFLVENKPQVLKLKVHKDLPPELQTLCAQVPFGRCLCGRAAQSKKIMFADCVDNRHDIFFPGMKPHGHYCIPILSAEKDLLGVFTLYAREGHRRDKRIEEIMLAIADVMASTIERLQALNEKRKMESQLQQAYKMEAIGTLAGGIAHDFNNILGAILGYASMAKDDAPPGSSLSEDLDQVLISGNRAKELVKQILAFSRQADTERIPFQPVNIVKEAIKMLRPAIPATIDIKQDIDPKVGAIFADPSQVYQILMNLCTNAFHAMEDTGGTIEISLKETELDPENLVHEPGIEAKTFVQLTVKDTGPGISPEIRDKIFDPYFTTKAAGKGTGMGLAIIHGIIKSYGGFISLDSESGRGAAFHVYIPAVAKEVLSETTELEAIPRGEERILFIDDEEHLAQMSKDMLERIGYSVTVRQSSIEALEKFQNQPDLFDLVITDQTMPGITGADLARRMLQIRPDLPIILCTGFSSQMDEEKAKAIGIKEFAYKPLVKKDIAMLIRKVLDEQ